MFSSDLYLSLFLCQQHYEKTALPICMKFSGKVWSDRETTCLHFGSIRVNGSAGQRSVCLLSPAIALRTGVNKSVAFARWKQGRGLLCLAPQLIITFLHPRPSRRKSMALKHFCKCFISHVATVYLQAVFDPAKNVLQYFCKCFSVKHFKNILRGGYGETFL